MKQITNWSQATVFDCETNGLLKEAVLYHVLSFQMKGKENPSSIPGEVKDRLINFFKWHLDNKVPVVAHNAILYDIPVAEKILGLDLSELMVIDTLPLSWYLNVNRKQHGLDSFHSDYGIEKPKIEDWSNLSYEEYQHRCQEDVRINVALWEDFKERLIDMYTKAKDAIDAGLVGGKRVSDDEVIYIDRLKGIPVEQHIDQILTFLMGKMDTYRLQEKRGFLMDVEHLLMKDKEFDEKINSVKTELESVMPMVPEYTKRKKPKELFKKNGDYSVSGAKWIELVRKYKEKELDEHGNQIVIISDNEIKDSEGRVRSADFIEEFKEITKYKPANANSVDQIKSLLYSHGWVPESFNEVDDEPAIEKWIANGKRWKDKPPKRKVPQVTIKGEDGKELCPSVERLAEDVPQIKLYSNYNLVKHRSGVIKGFLKNMDPDTHHIEASIGGLTNTLRVCHRNVVNLVGVDKPYGEDIRGAFIAGEGNIALGSDLSSLEDRVKHHFMIPHDPEYVKTMMASDFDPHILMALVAKFITQEEFDAFKADKDHAPKHVKSARKSGKSCLPVDNTQVLTKQGWKWFHELNENDVVYGIDGDFVKETVILDSVNYTDSSVYSLKVGSWEVESTGNHRWLVDKQIHSRKNRRVERIYSTTENITASMNIITSGEYVGGESNTSELEASLIGWILSDGHLDVSKASGKTSQGLDGRRQWVKCSVAQSKRKFYSEIKETLVKLGADFTEITRDIDDVVSFKLSSPWIRDFLNKVGLPLENKHNINYEKWILSLSKESLKSFFESFFKGDGGTSEKSVKFKTKKIYQKPGKISEAIKLTMNLLGMNTLTNKNSSNGMLVIRGQNRKHIGCQRIKREYVRNSEVFCLTTGLGNFIIRQGGVITITGNCNYASQYNAGGPTIAKTAGVSEAEGYLLHEAYWGLNWSIKKIAEEQVVIETCRNIRDPLKWLINPINGMLYNIRKEGDIFSTLCQGTGSFFFDMWIDNVLNAMYNVFKMKTISLQMHDEGVWVFKDTDKFRKIFYKFVDDAIKKVNVDYLLRRELACDIQFGNRYSEIH